MAQGLRRIVNKWISDRYTEAESDYRRRVNAGERGIGTAVADMKADLWATAEDLTRPRVR